MGMDSDTWAEILRAVANKLLGIAGMLLIPVGLATVPVVEAANPYANPVRRPLSFEVIPGGPIGCIEPDLLPKRVG